MDQCSPLSFLPWLKVFVASSLPATTGGNFIPMCQHVLPLTGRGYCQGIAGQGQTFSGWCFNLKHLLQGEAEWVVLVLVSLGLFSPVLLYRCLRAKGGPLKEDILRSQRGILAALKGHGSFSCLFAHTFLGREQYLPLMLQTRGPAASWLVLVADPGCQGGRVWWDAEMVPSYAAGCDELVWSCEPLRIGVNAM